MLLANTITAPVVNAAEAIATVAGNGSELVVVSVSRGLQRRDLRPKASKHSDGSMPSMWYSSHSGSWQRQDHRFCRCRQQLFPSFAQRLS